MKVIIFKKHRLIYLVIAMLLMSVCTINIGGNTAASIFVGSISKQLPIYGVQTDDDVLSISFDATWGSEKTASIMQMCHEYEAQATFFLTNIWIEDNQEMAKQIADEGFEIGLHSATHSDFTTLSVEQIQQEITDNAEMVKQICGVDATLVRLPYGYYNDTVINTITDMGYQVIQWSVDSWDWMDITADEIAARIIEKADKGSIILCHNNGENTVQAVRMVFEYFKLKKYSFVNIGNLIYQEEYTINFAGIQIKN